MLECTTWALCYQEHLFKTRMKVNVVSFRLSRQKMLLKFGSTGLKQYVFISIMGCVHAVRKDHEKDMFDALRIP